MPGTLVLQAPSMTIEPRSVFTPSFSRPRFSILPTTPTAAMTRSTVSFCVPPLPSSMVAVTLSDCLSSLVTLAPVNILMPCFSKLLRANAAISASSTGRICGSTSTTVTCEPSVRKKLADSMPVRPAPLPTSSARQDRGHHRAPRHLRAERAEEARELDADRARSDHQQRGRHPVGHQGLE